MDIKWSKPSRREALLAGAGLTGLRAGMMLAGGLVPAVYASAHGGCNSDLPVSQINGVFGVDGTPQPGGVLLFDFGRSDQMWTIFGVSVDADWGFDSEITFQPLCDSKALVKWEFCLLDDEVNPVWNALRSCNLFPKVTRVNALHNHFIDVLPEVKFLHGTAIGDAVAIAQALFQALKNNSGQPFQASPPQDTHLPNDQITEIIGGMSMISGKVLTVDVDRKEKIEELKVPLEPASQLESNFHFQTIGGNDAIVNAEFVLRPFEVDVVAETISSNGFKISAVHNHELFIKPRIYYLHSGASGDPISLAQVIRQALNQTNSKVG
jgi:uncharacterized protein DUF1259